MNPEGIAQGRSVIVEFCEGPLALEKHYDVVIAGGGIIGSACAYFLAQDANFTGSIAVIEPDPFYSKAATTLSASSIRQQFSSPINIAISRFGFEFLRQASSALAIEDVEPDIGLVESSYLYLASELGAKALQQNVEVQLTSGVPVTLCNSNNLQLRYPWLNVTDIVAGAFTEQGEGWFDSYQLLMSLKKKAVESGAEYVVSQVKDIGLHNSRKVRGVTLSDGSHIQCEHFVNATGTNGRAIASKLDIEIPVFPRMRCVYVFKCKAPIGDCPLVIDPSGLWFRPEGSQFICGLPPSPDNNVEATDFVVDHELFEDRIWPLLANRVPDFNEIKLTNSWAGHYDYNTFDQNAIVGPHPEIENFIFANGFSGHGLQQAPAIGRGISEYITYGHYRSLDLSPLSFNRLVNNLPLIEANII